MNRSRHPLIIGFFTVAFGICFFFSPVGQKIEENLGLAVLFKMRGPRTPPDEVVIVNIDSASSQVLGLPSNISKWPRSIHAELVNTLKRLGASVVAFDVHFADSRNREQDLDFTAAVQQAGNVILFEELNRRRANQNRQGQEVGTAVELDTLVPPFSPLAESALALAPFPLPKLPVRVNQTWIFKGSIGEKPTLPAVALQAIGLKHYENLYTMLSSRNPQFLDSLPPASEEAVSRFGLVGLIRKFREAFQRDPSLVNQLLSDISASVTAPPSLEEHKMLEALVRMYGGGNSIYLNLYGPPGTITTFSYHELLSEAGNGLEVNESHIKGKTVFVGAARKNWSEQKDGFYTVFSQPNGLDLSGVELAATTFANLLENMSLKSLAQWKNAVLLVMWGITVTFVCYFFSPVLAIVSLIVLSAFYLVVGNYYFTAGGFWPPIITTLTFQSASAFLASVLSKYFKAGREKENIRKALGFYLPDKVVSELSKDLSFIKTGDQMVYSACLMTDAQQYTSLSEKMEPRQLSLHMKEYFSYIYGPVTGKGGLVCDVVGDSMLALWPAARLDVHLRQNACQAALQILVEVDRFNRKHQNNELPTRVGLHFGYILMGNMGAESHFEYAPVGDTVNTVSRIENLNKYLGTRILASEETVQEISGLLTRKLGVFLLAGKSKPVVIYELLAEEDERDKKNEALCEHFQEALTLFQGRKWSLAIKAFTQCEDLQGVDGPSRFYLQLCETYQHNPPAPDWRGVIHIDKK